MKLTEYLKELSIVVLGIIIAFGLNNAGINHKQRIAQKQVLHTILNELKNNQKQVEPLRMNLDSLYNAFADLEDKKGIVSFDLYYYEFEAYSNGCETAKYTGALNGIDYDLLAQIVTVYEAQSDVAEMDKTMYNNLLSLPKTGIDKAYMNYLLLYLQNYKSSLLDYGAKQEALIGKLEAYLN